MIDASRLLLYGGRLRYRAKNSGAMTPIYKLVTKLSGCSEKLYLNTPALHRQEALLGEMKNKKSTPVGLEPTPPKRVDF